jgi:hypothetical protein
MRARLFLCTGTLALVLAFLASNSAPANTFVLIFRTEEACIIAADSKESRTQGLDGGFTCKVHITDNVVWATTGIVRQLNGPLDLWATARSAIATGGSLDDIVSKFDTNAAEQLKTLLPWLKTANPESYKAATKIPYVVTSAFIQRGILRVTYFHLSDDRFPENIEIIRHDCPGLDCPTGHLRHFGVAAKRHVRLAPCRTNALSSLACPVSRGRRATTLSSQSGSSKWPARSKPRQAASCGDAAWAAEAGTGALPCWG